MIATKDAPAQIASYSLRMLGSSCDVESVTIDAITYRATDPLLLAFLLAVKQREGLESLDEADALMRKRIRLKRTDIGEIHGKQVEQMQEVVAAKMAGPFLRSVKETARRIAKRTDKPDPDNAEKQAEKIVKATFDLEKANLEIFTAAAETLPVVFAAGVMAELVILEAVTDKASKRTTAQEIAQRLEIDTALLPFSIGRMPEWLLEAARESLGEAFAQDYWQDIGKTTRNDIETTVQDGIERGLSMRKVAAAIVEKHGGLYSMTRAMMVARTETPNALLGGHAAGISQLEEEAGFPIGKEWLSAFQTFSRGSHTAKDGSRTKTANGMFTLNGVRIPWPAHTNLPAKDRVNCLCNMISDVTADSLEGVSRAAEAELTGEDEPSLVDELENRSADIKKMKKEQLHVLTKDGKELFVKDGSEDSVQLTAAELKKMKDAVTLHNHPALNGAVTSFSHADISGALQRGEFASHVVTEQGHRFSMTYEKLGKLTRTQRLKLGKNVASDYNESLKKQAKIHAAQVRKRKMTPEEATLRISDRAWKTVAEKHKLTYKGL